MKRVAVVVALALVALVVTGCGQSTGRRARTTTMHPVSPGRPNRLYTHCGIVWARIDGTFWRATPARSDGNGNPPRGWGNPYQNGRLRVINRTTAVFRSRAGVVRFKRTAATAPQLLCS
jgi:hypothetical protein